MMAGQNKVQTTFYAVYKNGKYMKESSLEDIIVSHYDFLFRRECSVQRTKLYLINKDNEIITSDFGKFEIAQIYVDGPYKTVNSKFEVSLLDKESKELKKYKSDHKYFEAFFQSFFGFMNELDAEGDWDRFEKIKNLERDNSHLKKEVERLESELAKLKS